MDRSKYMERAQNLVEGIENRSLTIEERRQTAIELASLLIKEAKRNQTSYEHRQQEQLDRMMEDSVGKAFTTQMTDECFRSRNVHRVADQLLFLIHKFGIPKYLSYYRQVQLYLFKLFGKKLAPLLVPLARHALRKETSSVIVPGERRLLAKHMERRKKEGVRVNLNQLGEAILGEGEAKKRLQLYLDDLARPEVEYISVKISTLCSQINMVAWSDTLTILEQRLKQLFRAAMQHTYVRPGGKLVPKFVNLDMEEYRDLHLTVELFQKVLDDPEFYQHSAGIVLQSYLPDSYLIQQELTVWAMRRVANGGAPIKIRLVKGANLAMEKVEASLRGWPQAPYTTKADVDANYKRMLSYGCVQEHAQAAHIGVGSHNLFDIAYTILLRKEHGVEKYVEFEMLEGMADNMRRAVQELTGEMLLYCPAVKEKDFTNAVAYLLRRLDENAAPENFLRHVFGLIPGTEQWQEQANNFSLACHAASAVSISPRKTQNRFKEPIHPDPRASFQNEPDTDWSLPQNRKWVQNLLDQWRTREIEDVPVVIAGKQIHSKEWFGVGQDPSCPEAELYRYTLAESSLIDKALKASKKAEKKWGQTPVKERSAQLVRLAELIRENRGDLIGAMVADGGKIVEDADIEVSEAVDFVEYYRRNMEELSRLEDLTWAPKGTILVAPPWNFPCSIPIGGIAAALAAGNCVIFKPALETAYVGWRLALLCWEAGFSTDVVQFILCEDEPFGSQLIQDTRINAVLLTGATDTAKKMLKMRPGLDLIAETGGKNALIITAISDRDLAVKDLVQSAFAHSGQKCSACSLAICEAEVYDDPGFRKTLKDAVSSLPAGPSWNLTTRINPLIKEPGDTLLRGLTELEDGQSWLLAPEQHPDNPNVWTPGIKLGVTEDSFTYQNELFGPVLGLMRADNLEHAIKLSNGTRYGLTSGIHTLDEREEKEWIKRIEAGNCYVNRGITGAIVRRQPFGGCKESSFGPGAKAGGPNYLLQLMTPKQGALPEKKETVIGRVSVLTPYLEKMGVSKDEMHIWEASIGSYAYYWKEEFGKTQDLSLVLGQDNILKYVHHRVILFRINQSDAPLDVMRIVAAAQTCRTPLKISGDSDSLRPLLRGEWSKLVEDVTFIEETEEEFIEHYKQVPAHRVRFISPPSLKVKQVLAEFACNMTIAPPIANGRVELTHFVREVALSINYHRYGNLGVREDEARAPIL